MPYIAHIMLLVDVETVTDVDDAIAESLRPLMNDHEPTSCFLDWAYEAAPGEEPIEKTLPIPVDFKQDDNWDPFRVD